MLTVGLLAVSEMAHACLLCYTKIVSQPVAPCMNTNLSTILPQSQIQDFPKEAPPCEVPSRRDSVGGGVVAEFFFSVASESRRDFQWGGGSTRNFPLVGLFYIFRLSQRGARAPRPPPPESATVTPLHYSGRRGRH